MYAVIETGGKQYRVEVGTELEVELLDVEPGQSITLDRVLLVADGGDATVGTPVVAGAAVEAEVVGATRGDKVIAFKYRPKARRRVKKGHRQDLTVLRIADIVLDGKRAADDTSRTSKADERQRIAEAAARQAAEDAALAAKLNVAAPEAEAPKPKTGPKAKAAKVEDEAPAETPAAEAQAEASTPAEAEGPGAVETAAAESDTSAKRTRTRAAKAETAEPAEEAAARDAAADEATETDDAAVAPKKRASRTKKDE